MNKHARIFLGLILFIAVFILAGHRVGGVVAESQTPHPDEFPPLSNGAPATPKNVIPDNVAPLVGTQFQTSPPAPVINVWYGAVQTFGVNGDPQKWVNISGNVSGPAPILSLTYSVNGGPTQSLATGDNKSRLIQTGDFNIELDYTDLIAGNNQVVVTATDTAAAVTTASITVVYQSASPWTPGSYVVDWSKGSKVNDVAQVVDGQWVIAGGKARTTATGYDRLIAIGDLSWRDYTVTVPVTVHSMNTSKSPGIGVMARWQGHYLAEDNVLPRTGWRRLGALAWYRYQKGTPDIEGLQLLGNLGRVRGEKPFTLALNTTYNFKLNIVSAPGSNTPATYRFKVWEASNPEPATWDIENTGFPGEPRSGGLLLVAHHADVSFGNVMVDLASIEPKPELNLSTAGTGSGTVAINPQRASYRFGEDVLLTAVAGADSVFAGWAGDLTGTANPATVEMFGNRSVTAVFNNPSLRPPLSDDFSGCELNAQRWTYVNPLGDATMTANGEHISLGVPGGTSHDLWTTGLNAPRIMQSAVDEDFAIDVKFDSAMSQKNQAQGILVEGNPQNFLRFNFAHDGSTYRIQAYTITNGNAKLRANQAIAIAPPMYLRVDRAGDAWNLLYSGNGASWTSAAAFTHSLGVSAYGVFVGNSAQNPAHTGLIDYFFNTASPIAPEDDGRRLNVAITGDGSVARVPDKERYGCGETVELTAVPASGFRFASWGGDLSGSENPVTVVMNETRNVTASFINDTYYSLQVTAVGPGTVARQPDKPAYAPGEIVVLTAVPSANAGFINWSGDATGTTAQVEVVMDKNKTITATFAENAYALTVIAGPNGTVTKTPDKSGYAPGEQVLLLATPAPGYVFAGWSGDLTGNTNPAVLMMNGNKNVTASFAPVGTITYSAYIPGIMR